MAVDPPSDLLPPREPPPPLRCCAWPPMPHVKRMVLAELKKQHPITLPLAAMNLTWFMKTVTTTAFLGRLGELQLAGGALGFTFANFTGFSVLTGLCAAMEPICGQAFGAKNYRLMHKTLLMATLLLLAVSLPISLLWLNVDKVLACFGQQPDMIVLAKKYVTWLLPDLVATSLLCPLKAYLSSQGVTVPILVSTAVSVALHVPLNMLLVRVKGLQGIAMAVWISDMNVAIMLAVYVFWSERRKGKGGDDDHDDSRDNIWEGAVGGGWCDQKLSDWVRLLRLAGQCCLTTCLEWWCYEILLLLTGHLPNAKEKVSVLTIVLNFDYLLFSLMISLATCTSTRVSNELGAGRASAARESACVSLCLGIVVGCISGSAMAAAGDGWGSLFSRDHGVVSGVKKMMMLMALVEVVNSPLNVCGGIVRGTANPQLGMYATLGGFYLVALPLGVLLAFKEKLGLAGLLLGFLAGAATTVTVLLVLMGRIDWEVESRKAQLLGGEKEGAGDDIRC